MSARAAVYHMLLRFIFSADTYFFFHSRRFTLFLIAAFSRYVIWGLATQRH